MHPPGTLPLTFEGSDQGFGSRTAKKRVGENPDASMHNATLYRMYK